MKPALLILFAFTGCNREALSLDMALSDGVVQGMADSFHTGDDAGPPDVSIPCPVPADPPSLAELQNAMVGSWRGDTTNPWTPPYTSALTFTADDHYSAHDVSDSTPAFYYGVDDDSPTKTYLLDNQLTNGDGTGEIQIAFAVGDLGNRGSLQHLRACANGNRIDFEFWATWSGNYGPVTFHLARTGL